MTWKLPSVAAILLALAGCTRTGCETLSLFGVEYDDRCGPAGSQGTLYFEEDMVKLILGAGIEEFGTESSSTVLDYLPTVTLGFRAIHLREGVSVGPDQTTFICSRRDGVGTSYVNYVGGAASLDVIGPSNRTQVGGQGWRFRWQVDCHPDAEMQAWGDDVIELFVVGTGWDPDLWGLPGDWPERWE